MRRFPIVLLALALGTASAASAQQPRQNPPPRGERANREQQARRPDFFAAALRGIELSAAQREQLDAVRKQYRPAGRPGLRGAGARERGDSAWTRGQRPDRQERADSVRARRGQRSEGRPARSDTAQIRERREQLRARMDAHREQMIADVRALLTPAQRPQFEQNLQQLQQRLEQRAARHPAGRTAARNGGTERHGKAAQNDGTERRHGTAAGVRSR